MVRMLTFRIARRSCLAVVLFFLVVTTFVRAYSFFLTRRMQAVISGLSKVRIDETTEEEVLQTVSYLVRGEQDLHIQRNSEVGDVDISTERGYFVVISNEDSWMRFVPLAWRFSNVEMSRDGSTHSWLLTVADLLGFRYVGFHAAVWLLDGKVSSVSYGIADVLVMPRALGEVVSVRSAHGYWAHYQGGFGVLSTDDENLAFRVRGSRGGDDHRQLSVVLSPDAAPALKAQAFQVNLTCFWGLFACQHASRIAPLLWQVKNAVEAETLARLKSHEPCPDRILAGRVRYLPDVNIALLESTGLKPQGAGEGNLTVDTLAAHYKLIEVLRGGSSRTWEGVRIGATIPHPGDYWRTLPNSGLKWAPAGDRVLAFSGPFFESCSIVAATPSALAAVRNTTPASKRSEDGQEGLVLQ